MRTNNIEVAKQALNRGKSVCVWNAWKWCDVTDITHQGKFIYCKHDGQTKILLTGGTNEEFLIEEKVAPQK